MMEDKDGINKLGMDVDVDLSSMDVRYMNFTFWLVDTFILCDVNGNRLGKKSVLY